MSVYKNAASTGTVSHEFEQQSRRYLGNKYKLISFLQEIVRQKCGSVESVCDAFAGTGVVGAAFNTSNVQIITNDLLKSNYVCLCTFLSVTHDYRTRIEQLVKHLNNVRVNTPNYFSENFGGTYFSYPNAMKIGTIRNEIERVATNESEKNILLCSLLYATDKVANTVGHYDAFRKSMDTLNPVRLGIPVIHVSENAGNLAYCEDANTLVRKVHCDLLYIDPPYNSRQYVDSYHLLENLVEGKEPELHGVCKKMDRSHLKSEYCVNGAAEALRDLVDHADCRKILLSYNNTGSSMDGRSNARIRDEEIVEILSRRGTVEIFSTEYSTFSTGRHHHNRNLERVFFCRLSN